MNCGSQRIHLIAATAAALSLGTAAAEFLPLSPGPCLLVAWVLFIGSSMFGRLTPLSVVSCARLRFACMAAVIALLAAARWTMIAEANATRPLHHLAQRVDLSLIADVVIGSVPVEHERPAARLDAGRDTQRWQTRFVGECSAIRIGGDRVTVDGTIRVLINGQAARRFRLGDTVRMTGRMSWPTRPGNPGEFDFASFLRRRDCAGMFFVAHPDAVEIVHQVGPMSPGYWLTWLRRAAQSALNNAVSPDYRSIAAALLLGSRSEILAETEEVFIGSGTMHLLAISGLHIGILCLLLVRLGHWLLIPWNRRLVMIAALCIVYAFMTDLRPSVVRATVFAILFTMSQILLRQVSLAAVIGQTACLMLLWQPYLVFDRGAWLSFLSVTGLALATRSIPLDVMRDSLGASTMDAVAPLTPREHLQEAMFQIRHWLAGRYRPMLWILAATIPLTAWTFHVVSPVGLIINVVLIIYTMFTLWLGFATILVGVLLPFVPNLPGIGFSWMLAGLTSMVETSASIGVGHLYLADLPWWFLLSWYVLLMAAVSVGHKRQKQIIWLFLCGLTSTVLWERADTRFDGHFHCTILDVGHGSAAVVELPTGGVMLVDAGAMNRGDRAGEIVSRCLWQRGHRMINSILVSHADVDHFNALGMVLPRFPVGELLLSQHFLHNSSPAARQLVTLATDHGVPVRVVGNGEFFTSTNVDIQILQASPKHLAEARSDNEKSLVVQIRYGGKTILLPGDLEGAALEDMLGRLPHADVLVSPHHGSLKANTPAVADRLRPRHVIISARDDVYRIPLSQIYDASILHFTSNCGAVQVDVTEQGILSVDEFRAPNHW